MAADHSVLCSALPVSLYHIRMLSALCLVSILIVKLLLSRANTLSHFTLSLSVAPRVTSRVTHTSLYNENYSRLPGNSLDINIFVYFLLCCTHTHAHRHSLTHLLTHPRLLAAYKFLLFVLAFVAVRSRRVVATSLLARACVASFCVCVCVRFSLLSSSSRRRRCRCVFFVVASSSSSSRVLLLYARSFAYKFQHYLKVVLCPFCVRSLSLFLSFVCSLAFCVRSLV